MRRLCEEFDYRSFIKDHQGVESKLGGRYFITLHSNKHRTFQSNLKLILDERKSRYIKLRQINQNLEHLHRMHITRDQREPRPLRRL